MIGFLNVAQDMLATETRKQENGSMSQNTKDSNLTGPMEKMVQKLRVDHETGQISFKPATMNSSAVWRSLIKRGFIVETKGTPPTGILTERGLACDTPTFQVGK